MTLRFILILALAGCGVFSQCAAQSFIGDAGQASPASIGWPYPAPVHYLSLKLSAQDVRMAYMDVAPSTSPNGRTVVLMHGKNFGGAYFAPLMTHLSAHGFRVLVPDQIGFGRSSKPALAYSFDLLAANTLALLDTLGVKRVVLIGHSTGGMLATRFTLRYPERVEQLVLEDPIGLEDYQAEEPVHSLDFWYQAQLNQTEEGVKQLFHNYFVTWKPSYDAELLEPALEDLRSGEYPRIAMASALTYLMILQQPVVYELAQIKVPTLLVYGEEDKTAIGKAYANPELRPRMGNFAVMSEAAAKVIPNARVVPIASSGHIPHIEQPEAFDRVLDAFVNASS